MTSRDFYADAPLYTALRRYADKGMSSFHTPGHKGNASVLPLDLSLDLTELPETDSLFECNGVIRASEGRAASLFGAKYTAVSAGGCTLAIQGMLAAFVKPGDTVIFSRNIHRSAIHTAMLLDLRPRWLLHRRDAGEELPGRIVPEDVRAALEEQPKAAAVYITSPDYYGCLSDIGGIAAVCREYGVPLLVDNAHGTHLIAFGKHPITLGASASACSAHKTLPVLTGGAWLHCNDEAVIPRIKSAMALFGSTSPSYLTMASLDIARAWMQAEGMTAYRETARRTAALRQLARQVGFGLPEGDCDPTRLTLLTADVGYDGEEAAVYFRACGAACEHSDHAAVIFILTPFNTARDWERLRNAVAAFPRRQPLDTADLWGRSDGLPTCAASPREVLEGAKVSVPTAQAEGKIAAEAACPCPPGVPVVMPGEIIDGQCVKILLNTGIQRINVLQ